MIIEDLMLDLMYSVPGQKKLREVVDHARGRRGEGQVDHADRKGRLDRTAGVGLWAVGLAGPDAEARSPEPRNLNGSLRDAPHRPAAGRRRLPAHDDAVRHRTAVVDARARARAAQGQADLPGRAARRVDRRPAARRHLHDGLRRQHRPEPEAARRQHQGAGRGRRPRPRRRVEGRQGLLPRRRQGAAEADARPPATSKRR